MTTSTTLTTTAPSAWEDVLAGHEYTPSAPLTGWRISVALRDGALSPFLDHGSTVQAHCHADPADQHHDGELVHPGCVCGLYLTDSRSHLIDYWPDVNRRMGAVRDDVGSYRRGGAVICKVTTAGNVTGRATREGMTPPDSIHTYRTSAFTLRQVFVPTGTRPGLADRIASKYPDVAVVAMRGPLHTLAKLEYRWADQ